MPKRKKRPSDFAVTAFRVVQDATGQNEPTQDKPLDTEGKNPHAVALGRMGGKKGGPARAAKLSSARRRAIAKKAAKARWGS
jgi:hypothetical protein